MATGRDQAHSILEPVTQQPQYQAEQLDPLTNVPEKQVAIDEGKQCIEDKGGLEVAPKEDFDRRKSVVHGVPGQRFSARRRKILCGWAGLTIILGASLGGLFLLGRFLGARHKNSATVAVTPTQRNIAAVSFTSTSDSYTRVYFQDDVGQIIQASTSGDNLAWSINKTGFNGKNGSVIAAAVSHSDSPLAVSIFYLDVNNIINDISCTGSTGYCTSGTLSAQRYITMSNSSLSAMFHWCSLCANATIITFQDESGFVQIGNFTSGNWTLRKLDQSLEPEMGTGLALAWFPSDALTETINLYYQRSNLSMALATWRSNFTNYDEAERAENGWLLDAGIYGPIPSGAHIAAASIETPDAATWPEILSLSAVGIKVSRAYEKWETSDAYPMVMANITTNNKKIIESVAVTTLGNAFAVVKQDGKADAIENWQVSNGMLDWRLVGNVNLGGAWG
ncbi:hypothetical protein MMC07_005878 [Pseudocyphellaria aurata]|nr:hypothetical protein [Pseudocyphellaria aurata]